MMMTMMMMMMMMTTASIRYSDDCDYNAIHRFSWLHLFSTLRKRMIKDYGFHSFADAFKK